MQTQIQQIDFENVQTGFPAIVDVFGVAALKEQVDRFNLAVTKDARTIKDIAQPLHEVRTHLGSVSGPTLRALAYWSTSYKQPIVGAVSLLNCNLSLLSKRTDVGIYTDMLRNGSQFFQLLAEVDILAAWARFGVQVSGQNPLPNSRKNHDIKALFPQGTINGDVKWVENEYTRSQEKDFPSVVRLLFDAQANLLHVRVTKSFKNDEELLTAIVELESMLDQAKNGCNGPHRLDQFGAGKQLVTSTKEDPFIEYIVIEPGKEGLLVTQLETPYEENSIFQFNILQRNFRDASVYQLPKDIDERTENVVFIGSEVLLPEATSNVLYGKEIEFPTGHLSQDPEGFFSARPNEGEPGLDHVRGCVNFALRCLPCASPTMISVRRSAYLFERNGINRELARLLTDFCIHYTNSLVEIPPY